MHPTREVVGALLGAAARHGLEDDAFRCAVAGTDGPACASGVRAQDLYKGRAHAAALACS